MRKFGEKNTKRTSKRPHEDENPKTARIQTKQFERLSTVSFIRNGTLKQTGNGMGKTEKANARVRGNRREGKWKGMDTSKQRLQIRSPIDTKVERTMMPHKRGERETKARGSRYGA